MAVWSIIKKSELEGLQRIDPEYYHPRYFRILDVLRHLNTVPISEVAKPIKRGFKPDNNQYFYYIEISEVDISTGDVNAVKILSKEAPSRAQWIVKKGDVIISTVRPIRNAVALITEHENNFICSSGFAVLKPIKVSPEFLFTYLKTESIVQLFDRKTTATMYPAVSWEDVLSAPIFLPDNLTEKFVIQRVREAMRNLKKSETFYLRAEQMLLDKLGLDNFDFSQPNYYRVPLNQAQEVNRVDAEHFQPKYDKLIQHLKNKRKTAQIGDLLAEPIQKGLTPQYEPDGDIVVINSQHLGRYALNFEATDRTTYNFWNENKKAQIKYLDVMIYATGAYIGRTNCYLEKHKASAGVDILLVRPNFTCNPLYLAVYLNTILGIWQAEKFASGSGQRHIYPHDVTQFIVYLPSEEFQTKIANLVNKSYEARKRAKSLLEEAKKKVEGMIEKESFKNVF